MTSTRRLTCLDSRRLSRRVQYALLGSTERQTLVSRRQWRELADWTGGRYEGCSDGFPGWTTIGTALLGSLFARRVRQACSRGSDDSWCMCFDVAWVGF